MAIIKFICIITFPALIRMSDATELMMESMILAKVVICNESERVKLVV